MATDEQWFLIESTQNVCLSGTILELRDRIKALEAAQNLRQQDEDVKRVVADPHPVATDEELAVRFADAAKAAISGRKDYDKSLTFADIAKAQCRALYDLGIRHGQANSKPTAKRRDTSACQNIGSCDVNDHQVGSSAPADGLVEMLVNLLGHYGDGTARAAIRGVADWLQQRTDTIANGSQWADLLREEAGR
jgi:hypothetical protein